MNVRNLILLLAAVGFIQAQTAHSQGFSPSASLALTVNPALTFKPGFTVDPSVLIPAVAPLDLFQPQFDSSAIKALSFKAYTYQDPETGKAISGTTVLTLPNGSKVTASEYYQKLNEQEVFLNAQGSTLRSSQDNYGEVQKPISTVLLLAAQKDLALRSIAAFQVSKADVLALSNPGFTSAFKPALAGALLPAGTPSKSPTCTTKDKVSMPKSWSHRAGNDDFNVQLAANAKFEATCDVFTANAEGKLDAAAFKTRFSVARGVMSAIAERNKNYRANLDVYVIGKKVWNYSKAQKNNFSFGNTYSYAISYEYSIHVPIGPVRAALTVGTAGDAHFGYSFKFDGLAANASVNPGVKASLFARGGVNVYVAEVGAGGSFLLVNLDMPLSLLAEVTPRSGSLYLHGKLLGSIDVSTLSGRLFGYADVYVPRWGVPPWKKKHYEVTVTKWNGIDYDKTLFNEEVWTKAI